MTDVLKLEILGEPVPWSVPQIFRGKGRRKNPDLVNWQSTVRLAFLSQEGDYELIDGPILVRYLIIRRTKPKSCKAKWPDTKPDLDNYEKAIWDSLEGLAYTNDSRIVYKMSVQKIWATDENPPGVSLQIERMK
jgi:Holliday junction resolvase RusA-like endonuclease